MLVFLGADVAGARGRPTNGVSCPVNYSKYIPKYIPLVGTLASTGIHWHPPGHWHLLLLQGSPVTLTAIPAAGDEATIRQ